MSVARLRIGADPEIFLEKGEQFASAFDVIPGTKNKPYPVDDGAVQVDGMALEFNINPADTEDEWQHNISSVLRTLRDMVPEEYTFSDKATALFETDYFNSQPLAARKLGCDPDFDAYTGHPNPSPDSVLPIRTAAGHVHLGWIEGDMGDHAHLEECKVFCKELDFYLGVPSLLLDTDSRRRMMYGNAGSFRPKPYGVEYRVLSNFWLKSTEYRSWVYRQCHKAYNNIMDGVFFNREGNFYRDIINYDDTSAAKVQVDVYGKGYFGLETCNEVSRLL